MSLIPPDPGAGLTDRQKFALACVERYREGLSTAEMGALLHERKGVHADWQRCKWCSKDGLGVLRALAKRELVKRRRTGQWQLTKIGRGVGGIRDDTDSARSARYDPATARIPF